MRKLNTKLSLKLLIAALCASFACLLPQSLSKPHEVAVAVPRFKAVKALAVPKVASATELQPEAVAAPVEAPAPVSPAPAPVAASATDCGSDPYLAYIYQHESGCCPTKWQGMAACPGSYSAMNSVYNASIGYGLCQSTPAIKMADTGADWATNWATQDNWCRAYALARYGSTYAAYLHWLSSHNW